MNDQSFDPSKLVMTNGLTQGYQRKPKYIMVKSTVLLMTSITLAYVVYSSLVSS